MIDKLNHHCLDFNKLKYNIGNMKEVFRREEVKSMGEVRSKTKLEELICKYLEESKKRQSKEEEWMKSFIKNTRLTLKAHDDGIKNLEVKVEKCTEAIHEHMRKKKETMDYVEMAKAKEYGTSELMKLGVEITNNEGSSREPITFSKKVKRRIEREQKESLLKSLGNLHVNLPLVDTLKHKSDDIKCLQELLEKKFKVEEVASIKLNVRCLAVLRNELLPKEKDPGSFTLSCLIVSLTVSNALTDLGASISIMPFSMFKRLGIDNLEQTKMEIEMTDKSMQSP